MQQTKKGLLAEQFLEEQFVEEQVLMEQLSEEHMVQNMVQEYVFRSIVRGAAQSETDFICEALPGALEEEILIGKGLFSKVAWMIYGMWQNMGQE